MPDDMTTTAPLDAAAIAAANADVSVAGASAALLAPSETFRIPNVAIHIPGIHSRLKIEPRYTLKLFQAMWKGAIKDPMDPVRIIPFPGGLSKQALYRETAGPIEIAMQEESARLRVLFGLHQSGEPLFDVIYPADSFEAAFRAAIEGGAAKPQAAALAAVALLSEVDGIGTAMAKKLVEAGIDTLQKLAFADADMLKRTLGATRALKAQTAAMEAIDVPQETRDTAALPAARP